LKITGTIIVGAGAIILILKGQYTPAVGLLSVTLGYVFGASQREKPRWP